MEIIIISKVDIYHCFFIVVLVGAIVRSLMANLPLEGNANVLEKKLGES